MKTKILNKLSEIEKENNIEILFAVESGSRAWGFESPDSDYDIRFVYKHKKEWYLNLWEQKDTIQFMTEDDLDGSGWELKKALKLLAKSNASFLGWLFSPIVYREKTGFLNDFKTLATNNFNPVTGFYHYHSMSKGFEETLDTDKMTLKSYFYAIRTALCANWIYKKGTIPPVLFTELFSLIEDKYHSKFNNLIALKSKEIEKSTEPVEASLINLVRDIVIENESIKNDLINKKSNPEEFNCFFKKELSILSLDIKSENLALVIESKYITNYGAQLGEVFCEIFEKDEDIDDFKFLIKKLFKNELIDNQKIKKEDFQETEYNQAFNILISSIIKESKYEEHFMTWDEGKQLANVFFNEFNEIEKIYCNSSWKNSSLKPISSKELSINGYNNISWNYRYDYGLIITSKSHIGIIWFGDDS